MIPILATVKMRIMLFISDANEPISVEIFLSDDVLPFNTSIK